MIKEIEQEVFRLVTKAVKSIDYLKNSLKAITDFFLRIKNSMSQDIQLIKKADFVSSEVINKYIDYIERDINLIKNEQQNIKSRILSAWNSVEQIKKPDEEVKMYDDLFLKENPSISEFNTTVLGVKSYTDAVPTLKAPPVLNTISSDKDISVYYGKSYGRWIEGNETGEDGIRPAANDGAVIVDDKDTFWEAEGVVLQEEREDAVFSQQIKDTEINLTTTVKFVFSEGMDINTITVIPHSFSSSTYYKIVLAVASNGYEQKPIDIPETLITKETVFTFESPFFNTEDKIKSINLTFKQEHGYYMKYDLGYFRIANNESWVDVTGPYVLDKVMKMSGDDNRNITTVINDAPSWIMDHWLPGVEYTETPVLDVLMGTGGYLTVQSRESKRKRYAMGITDIKIGHNTYEDISEGVTKEIDIPDNCTAVKIHSDDSVDGISYFVSVDDGLVWHRIIPVNREDIIKNFKPLPKKIYINSDISQTRKENSITGVDLNTNSPYIDTESKKIRIKVILVKGDDMETPVIKNFYPIFVTGNPYTKDE